MFVKLFSFLSVKTIHGIFERLGLLHNNLSDLSDRLCLLHWVFPYQDFLLLEILSIIWSPKKLTEVIRSVLYLHFLIGRDLSLDQRVFRFSGIKSLWRIFNNLFLIFKINWIQLIQKIFLFLLLTVPDSNNCEEKTLESFFKILFYRRQWGNVSARPVKETSRVIK